MEFAKNILALMERDLNQLKKELSAYENEADLWKTDGEVNNSAGNLALHLVGNLSMFVGRILGRTDYERDREFEFNGKNVPLANMLADIDDLKVVLANILPQLTEEQLSSNYRIKVLGYEMSTEYFLTHLYGHLNYHLGQVSYHRRLLG